MIALHSVYAASQLEEGFVEPGAAAHVDSRAVVEPGAPEDSRPTSSSGLGPRVSGSAQRLVRGGRKLLEEHATVRREARTLDAPGQQDLPALAGADLRSAVFSRSMTRSLRFHDRMRSGELVSRLTTDVGRVLDAVVAVTTTLLPDVLLLMAVLAVLTTLDPEQTLTTTVVAGPTPNLAFTPASSSS